MIVPGSSGGRRARVPTGTVLPFAAKHERRQAPDAEDAPQVSARPHPADRIQLLELEMEGGKLLDDMAGDTERPMETFEQDALQAFDRKAHERFAGIKDPALRASALRRVQSVRDAFQLEARALREDAEAGHRAGQVFAAAERVLAPERAPQERQYLFEQLMDAVDDAGLTREQGEEVRTAIAARVLRDGKGELLQGRLAGLKAPAERFMADLDARERAERQGRSADRPASDPAEAQPGGPDRPSTALEGNDRRTAATDALIDGLP